MKINTTEQLQEPETAFKILFGLQCSGYPRNARKTQTQRRQSWPGSKRWTTVNIQGNNSITLQSKCLLPDKVKTKVVGKRGATWKKKKRKKINVWFNLAQHVQYDGDSCWNGCTRPSNPINQWPLEMLLDKDPSVCGDADVFNRTVKKKVNYLNHLLRHKPNYYNCCRHGEGVEDSNSTLANKVKIYNKTMM